MESGGGTLREKVTAWLSDMVMSGILLTLLMLVAKLVIPIPWIVALTPLGGIIILLGTWFTGRVIAMILFQLLNTDR